MTAQAKIRDTDFVAEAARRALDDAKGDTREATRMLEEAVRQSRKLRDLLTEPLIGNACYDAVRGQVRADRRASWNAPAPTATVTPAKVDTSSRVVHLATGTLLMFPLPGGKRLGEATREEIGTAAAFYEGQSNDMAHKARWLRLVGQHLKGEKKVSDVLTDARLRELQQEAGRG